MTYVKANVGLSSAPSRARQRGASPFCDANADSRRDAPSDGGCPDLAKILEPPSQDGPPRGPIFAFGHPGDWDRMIRDLVIWGLAILAFLCGLIATLSLFGTKTQMAFLAERTSQLGTLISRTNENEKRVGSLTDELHKIQFKQLDTEAHAGQIDRIESSVAVLSRQTGNILTEIRSVEAKVDDRMSESDNKISQMELRLSKSEENYSAAVKPEVLDEGRSVSETQQGAAAPRANPLKNLSLVKIIGQSAWLARPQGWFHVELGSLLPGGAKILEIVRRNRRSIVLTDQGTITKPR